MKSETKSNDSAASRFNLSKLTIGSRVIVESCIGGLYELTMVDPTTNLITLFGTDPYLKDSGELFTYFVESWSDRKATLVFPDVIAKNALMTFRIDNTTFISEPVKSARIECGNWHYEAIGGTA